MRQTAVVQRQFGHESCAQTHFIFLWPYAESLCSFLDKKAADTASAQFGSSVRIDNEQISDWSVRNKNFLAVQRVATSIFHSVGLH